MTTHREHDHSGGGTQPALTLQAYQQAARRIRASTTRDETIILAPVGMQGAVGEIAELLTTIDTRGMPLLPPSFKARVAIFCGTWLSCVPSVFSRLDMPCETIEKLQQRSPEEFSPERSMSRPMECQVFIVRKQAFPQGTEEAPHMIPINSETPPPLPQESESVQSQGGVPLPPMILLNTVHPDLGRLYTVQETLARHLHTSIEAVHAGLNLFDVCCFTEQQDHPCNSLETIEAELHRIEEAYGVTFAELAANSRFILLLDGWNHFSYVESIAAFALLVAARSKQWPDILSVQFEHENDELTVLCELCLHEVQTVRDSRIQGKELQL